MFVCINADPKLNRNMGILMFLRQWSPGDIYIYVYIYIINVNMKTISSFIYSLQNPHNKFQIDAW